SRNPPKKAEKCVMPIPCRITSPTNSPPAAFTKVTAARSRPTCSSRSSCCVQAFRSSSTQGPSSLPSSLKVLPESFWAISVILSTCLSSSSRNAKSYCRAGSKRNRTESAQGPARSGLEIRGDKRGVGGAVDLERSNLTKFRRSYDMSWELLSAMGAARDAEFFHPAAKGIRVDIQDLGRAARAVDDPICLLED